MSDFKGQKLSWGRDDHGIPGANPNYSGRVGMIAAAVILIVGFGTFVLLTRGPAPNKAAAQYTADVANDDSTQPQLDEALHVSPATSSTTVHDFVQALIKEDRLLLTQVWPTRVKGDIGKLVTTNQHLISVMNKYPSASLSERVILLKRESNDASSGAYYGRQIRSALGAGPASS